MKSCLLAIMILMSFVSCSTNAITDGQKNQRAPDHRNQIGQNYKIYTNTRF